MHASTEIFGQIESRWAKGSIPSTPAFFYRTAYQWECAKVDDLESFYRQTHESKPYATVLLTSYTLAGKTMLVAHYESPTEACHRIWSPDATGSLRQVYSSPVESTEFAKAA